MKLFKLIDTNNVPIIWKNIPIFLDMQDEDRKKPEGYTSLVKKFLRPRYLPMKFTFLQIDVSELDSLPEGNYIDAHGQKCQKRDLLP